MKQLKLILCQTQKKMLLICVPASSSYPNIHQSLPVLAQRLIINQKEYLHNKACIYISDERITGGQKYCGQK